VGFGRLVRSTGVLWGRPDRRTEGVAGRGGGEGQKFGAADGVRGGGLAGGDFS